MELHGVDLMEWWLTKWLHDHGFPQVKARIGPDFQYGHNETTIFFALVTSENQNEKFLKFCQEWFDFPYECDDFIISFFHELGHYMTHYEWDESEWEDYFASVAYINTFKLPIEVYFGLPQEFMASDWGCLYIKEHPAEIEEFWRVCKKLIMNIYKLNNVEGGEQK